MAIDDTRAAPTPRLMRCAHALLVLVLLLATTAAVLHPYALDEHRSGDVCGLCLAGSHGGQAPLPDVVTVAVALTSVPRPRGERVDATSSLASPYRARAPPV